MSRPGPSRSSLVEVRRLNLFITSYTSLVPSHHGKVKGRVLGSGVYCPELGVVAKSGLAALFANSAWLVQVLATMKEGLKHYSHYSK